MDAMAEIRETFFLECEDLLEAMEADLIAWSEGRGDDETINAIFRAVHSIKGGAGAFSLENLVRFAHKFETTLDEVREGRLVPDEDALKVFLRGGDLLRDLVVAARDETGVDETAVDSLLAELVALTGEPMAPATPEPEGKVDFQPMALDFSLDDDDDDDEEDSAGFVPTPLGIAANHVYTITLDPDRRLYESGNETALLLRALSDLGTLETECDTGAVPMLDALDPEGSYLKWTIRLSTEHGEDAIRDVFEFVEGSANLVITEEAETDEPAMALAEPEVLAAPVEATPAPAAAKPSPAPAAAEEKEAHKAAAPKATVRVDLDRVDRLINLVGELVINQSMLAQCVHESDSAANPAVTTGLDEFAQLTREIQESVMAIRAQPVKPLFQRMSRIVREAGDATRKVVRLKTDGEATEVDKTVIERLSDPLTHMIRNAVDHGLETPDKREAAGKSREGTVHLSAAHRSGRVLIEVADDGAGINRERVKQIAIDKGLIPANADLSNAEIDNLLFMPGFSTAKEVSDLSGRGVGMDVVKRSIQSLGGRITITSEPGKGTTFQISLPLTLAVLDGMVVKVSENTLVLPLTAIIETLKPTREDIHEVCDGAKVVFIRGRFVPIVDVGFELGYREAMETYAGAVVLLVESDDGSLSALAVDSIVDQRQVVIKGLEDNYGSIPGVAAATILGDGRIALILDPDSLVASANPQGGPLGSDLPMTASMAHV